MRIDPQNIPENFKRLMRPEDRAALGVAGRTVEEVVAVADDKAELEIQADIAAYLRLHGIEYIKPDGRKKSTLPVGWPDFTFAFGGLSIGMEVKTPTGVLSKEQRERHEAMRANGWYVLIVHGVPEVQALLRRLEAEVTSLF